jgi:cytochrome c heme-lyase
VKSNSTEKGAGVKDFYINKDQFNVYGQKIDPSNNMPAVANQAPAPNQAIPLSTDRVPSNIPKGGTADGTWQYPSPQMFWNALVKKNKTEDASEEHMATVVAIHNNMNEKTWQQVLAWEDLDKQPEGSGREPKLLRFTGRPDELSPKARFRMLLGQPAPFDRHDWVVDRGGKLIRYVIDYYHDEEGAAKDEVPKSLMDMESMKSIRLDVRPALDSPGALFDRLVVMPIKRLTGSTTFKPLPIWWRPHVPQVVVSATLTPKQEELKMKWDGIKTKCEPIREKIAKCDEAKDPDACYMVNSIALQKCTASVVCPSVSKDLEAALNATDTGKIDLAFESVQKCLDDFGRDSRENLK